MAVAALTLFIVMFLLIFVARSVIQKRDTGDTGVRAGVLGAAPGSLEWLAGWLLVLAMIAAVAAPVAELFGLDPFVTHRSVRGVGVVLAVTGIATTFLAQVQMGAEWRIGIDENEVTALVAHGVFGIVRNPIFSAMIVTALGLTLMVLNPISLAGLVVLVAAIEIQVRVVEEPHLRRLHGSSYASYAARVGRFVPGVGRG